MACVEAVPAPNWMSRLFMPLPKSTEAYRSQSPPAPRTLPSATGLVPWLEAELPAGICLRALTGSVTLGRKGPISGLVDVVTDPELFTEDPEPFEDPDPPDPAEALFWTESGGGADPW